MSEKQPLTVTELSTAIKNVIEGSFEYVRVQGEVSGLKRAASGHTYFSLKDENSVINAIAWKGTAVPPQLADGLDVVCVGRVTTFAGNSRYQIIASSIEPAGQGALLKLLEELKQKLAKEGLFDAKHKKRIPFLPKTVGVITSPTGAVIRDIIHRISDRFPSHLVVYPVAVQGEGAAKQIAAAITNFNAMPESKRPDVLIVARGGGSLEDLWCFNEEMVVRAAFASQIPIISAVGHETDTTLIDYVADLRAPTPTGAAEKCVPVREDLVSAVDALQARLSYALAKGLEHKTQKIELLGKSLPDLTSVINNFYQKLDYKFEVLEKKFSHAMMGAESRFTLASRMLESVSYKNILKKGFALVLDSSHNPVTSSRSMPADGRLELQFQDGSVNAFLKEGKAKSARKKDETQGSLF